jgi:predicted nucleotidyltransferase
MGHAQAIKEITSVLRAKYHPDKIILFGSCAWGNIHRYSDIDMLIIKETNQPYRQRWFEVCRLARDLKRSIPFEPFVLTPKEIERQLSRNLFLQEIMKRGKVLYEKDEFH